MFILHLKNQIYAKHQSRTNVLSTLSILMSSKHPQSRGIGFSKILIISIISVIFGGLRRLSKQRMIWIFKFIIFWTYNYTTYKNDSSISKEMYIFTFTFKLEWFYIKLVLSFFHPPIKHQDQVIILLKWYTNLLILSFDGICDGSFLNIIIFTFFQFIIGWRIFRRNHYIHKFI